MSCVDKIGNAWVRRLRWRRPDPGFTCLRWDPMYPSRTHTHTCICPARRPPPPFPARDPAASPEAPGLVEAVFVEVKSSSRAGGDKRGFEMSAQELAKAQQEGARWAACGAGRACVKVVCVRSFAHSLVAPALMLCPSLHGAKHTSLLTTHHNA